MKAIYLFAGSFRPPTYGHQAIVLRFCRNDNHHVTIVCSRNSEKEATTYKNWFNTEESVGLWRYFNLPETVTIMTDQQFEENNPRTQDAFIIRGARKEENMKKEFEIALSCNDFSVSRNIIVSLADEEFSDYSSSQVRKLIEENKLGEVAQYVPLAMIPILVKRYQQLSTIKGKQLEFEF